MSGFESPLEQKKTFEHLKDRDQSILETYSPQEQQAIRYRQRVLSSLAYFIGKDFEIPVELNEPNQGWHWDFQNNVIRIDPNDLLLDRFNEKRKKSGQRELSAEEHSNHLRFVISHEGGHRRISRTDFIPKEQWQAPGFSFMMNAIEDPRDNNFVSETYPKFKEQMAIAYEHDLDMEDKSIEKAKEKLGYQPRFMKAGFEYIKQWFREVNGQEFELSDDLSPEVRDAVEKTLVHAQDSWWRYPSRQEADSSELLIRKYAEVSYEINRDKIWPEFKKLVDEDMEDQKMQEFMKDAQSGEQGEEGEGGQGLPQDMKDKLTPQEQQELEDAIKEAIENGQLDSKEESGEGTPIDLDSLSDELKEKLKEYINSLPEDKKKELQDKAKQAIGEFEQEIGEELQGKLTDTETQQDDVSKTQKSDVAEDVSTSDWAESEHKASSHRGDLRKSIEDALGGGSAKDSYREALENTAHLIDDLTGDLRDVFIKRKLHKTEAGYKHGRRWNVRKRIREKVAGIPLIKTESREQPESPSEEKDYAITLMIDLSGSMMRGGKIEEAFKSAVVLAETLHDLDIKFEVVGFQDVLLEFKSFENNFNDEMRSKLNQLLLEAENNNPGGHNNASDNNDGECLLEASRSLAEQYVDNKFLIVLSDGSPAMDSGKKSQSQLDQELKNAVREITENTNQKLIGIGLLSNAVARYYENNLPNVTTDEMASTLGEVLREIIEIS